MHKKKVALYEKDQGPYYFTNKIEIKHNITAQLKRNSVPSKTVYALKYSVKVHYSTSPGKQYSRNLARSTSPMRSKCF